MGLTLITPAATLPVALAEVKAVCQIEDASFDTALGLFLPGAVAMVGELIGRPLGLEVWRLALDGFSDAIELPKGPVTAAAVKYVNTIGVTGNVDPAIYSLDLVSVPQWVVRNSDQSWPTPLDGVNCVLVEFTAGYDSTTLPAPLKLAVCGLCKHWFENGADAGVPDGVMQQIAPWRQLWICA